MILHKISISGIRLIKGFEKFRATMYYDQSGLPTIGYGTLIDTAAEQWLMTATITKEQAENLMFADLAYTEKMMNRMIISPVNQNQWDALVSFTYNCGPENLRISTLLRKVNKNPNDTSIRKEFPKWHHSNGKDSNGLMKRRALEADYYFKPVNNV